MTKEMELQLKDLDYGTFGERNFFRKYLCAKFVDQLIHSRPDKINVAISDSSAPTSFEIHVSKTGYYRWWYRIPNKCWSGMHIAAEEAVAKFFPSLSEKGDDIGRLWIKIC